MCNTPLKVGVLLGGHSEEREVSLQTGKAVIRACRSLGYTTFPIEIESTLDPYMSRLKQMDLVFIALHGGIGENGHIQQQLEIFRFPILAQIRKVHHYVWIKIYQKNWQNLLESKRQIG